jgi:hypothetical protein
MLLVSDDVPPSFATFTRLTVSLVRWSWAL